MQYIYNKINKILDINICAFNNWNDDWFIGATSSSFFSYLIFMCNTDKKLAILAVANNNDCESTNTKTYYLIIIIYIDFLFCFSFFSMQYIYFFCFLDSIILILDIQDNTSLYIYIYIKYLMISYQSNIIFQNLIASRITILANTKYDKRKNEPLPLFIILYSYTH